MSVKRMLREVDSAEFSEWLAYSTIEPFGPSREDDRAGTIAAIIANVNRDPKRRAEPYGPDDFFPRFETATSEESAAAPDLESKIMSWAAKMNTAAAVNKSEPRPKTKG